MQASIFANYSPPTTLCIAARYQFQSNSNWCSRGTSKHFFPPLTLLLLLGIKVGINLFYFSRCYHCAMFEHILEKLRTQ